MKFKLEITEFNKKTFWSTFTGINYYWNKLINTIFKK